MVISYKTFCMNTRIGVYGMKEEQTLHAHYHTVASGFGAGSPNDVCLHISHHTTTWGYSDHGAGPCMA